ncbi:MAG: MiaB/RimO family radical SAM methylthiotransferase [Planctomycetota bacterium]|nr:MiaB/RimO family radical SAM methylthiotransferase [Planctomycetota bacterium]
MKQERSIPAELRTVSFVSLGCPKNLVDSEKMLGTLAQDGLIPVSYDPSDHDWEHDDAFGVEGKSSAERGATASDHGHIEPADVVVINTCGFLEASKDESLAVIKDAVRAKAAGLVKRVVVAGCLVQRHRAKMLEWEPGIDAMVGVFDRDKIVEAVRGVPAARQEALGAEAQPKYWIAGNALKAAQDRGMETVGLTVQGKDGKGVGYFEDDSARLRLTPRHYAYLRISEGCNQKCAFCTIPSIRGKMRSKPIERIVAEARELIADGAFELNLIGQDTTSYGDDIGVGWGDARSPRPSPKGRGGKAGGLPMMLDAIDRAAESTGAPVWLRLMYAYPSNFRDEFIDAIAEIVSRGRLLPYIDIPLQHASDRVLELMRRHVSADQQRELMHKLRERVPGMAIRTTFISGFPGETEADHEQLLGFVEEVGFDAVGVFEYSQEPGTPAGTMELDPGLAVPAEVKSRRKGEILALQQGIAFEQAAFVAEQFDERDPMNTGQRFDVLIDRDTGLQTQISGDSSQTQSPGLQSGRDADQPPTEVGGSEHAERGSENAQHGSENRSTVYQGRTYFQAPSIDAVTFVQSRGRLSPGELVRCVVVGSDGYDLIARPVDEIEKRVSLSVLR